MQTLFSTQTSLAKGIWGRSCSQLARRRGRPPSAYLGGRKSRSPWSLGYQSRSPPRISAVQCSAGLPTRRRGVPHLFCPQPHLFTGTFTVTRAWVHGPRVRCSCATGSLTPQALWKVTTTFGHGGTTFSRALVQIVAHRDCSGYQ